MDRYHHPSPARPPVGRSARLPAVRPAQLPAVRPARLPAGRPAEPDAGIARIASRQLGVISLEQLYELGLTYEQVRTRVRAGRLHPLYRGVYAVGHRSLSPTARLLAAQLAAGPGAFLSHRSAAGVRGLRAVNPFAIELTATGAGGRRLPAPIVLHRTRAAPHSSEVVDHGLLRISSLARMLLELAPRESPQELERLITQSVRRGQFNLDRIEEALLRHGRRPGSVLLRAALAAYRPRRDRHSELERAFDRVLDGIAEVPPPQRNVHVLGWELDYFWPALMLDFELDGRPYHVAVRDIERDRFKDAKLALHGIVVVRFTDWRFEHDLPGIVGDVRQIVSLRRQEMLLRAPAARLRLPRA